MNECRKTPFRECIPWYNHQASNCQLLPHRILNYLWDMRHPTKLEHKRVHVIFYMHAVSLSSQGKLFNFHVGLHIALTHLKILVFEKVMHLLNFKQWGRRVKFSTANSNLIKLSLSISLFSKHSNNHNQFEWNVFWSEESIVKLFMASQKQTGNRKVSDIQPFSDRKWNVKRTICHMEIYI